MKRMRPSAATVEPRTAGPAPFTFVVHSGEIAVGMVQQIHEASVRPTRLRARARNGLWTVWHPAGTPVWLFSHSDSVRAAAARLERVGAHGWTSSPSVEFLERGCFGWWCAGAKKLPESLATLSSMRMLVCDAADLETVAQWGYGLADTLADGETLDEDFMTGEHLLTPGCVHIKDAEQPEDYNLGWFVREPACWSRAQHLSFGPALKRAVFTLLLCINRLQLRFPLPAPLLDSIIARAAEDQAPPEVVMFCWDPQYGAMEWTGRADFGGGVVATWDVARAGNN